jgi:acyl-CoA reductase-like NAD-dependent aldehyde dehydrogenase
MRIGGEAIPHTSERRIILMDPATEEELGVIPDATPEQVDTAVRTARSAFDEGPWWREWGPSKRAQCLRKLAELCKAREKELSELESLNVGAPIGVTRRFNLQALIRNLEYYAGFADKISGRVVPLNSRNQFDYTLREPYGVIASLIPWNTPLLFVGSKLAPALAVGNVVILKPSEQACLSVLRVGDLIEEAGFPEGVVQILTGGPEVGAHLVRHPGVDKVSFTGGCAIARKVLEATASTLKPTMMELGGKSPQILFEDADLDRAMMFVIVGTFPLTGQACAASTRLLVHESLYPAFLERLKEMTATLPIGDPLDPTVMLGPLVSRRQKERVEGFVERALKEGAKLFYRRELPPELKERGYFMGPVIFTDVDPGMEIWKEEVFGPVVVVTKFQKEEEAIELANATDYGLSAGIWTRDLSRAHRVAERIRAGMIWINTYGMIPYTAPFGGYKQSGWGREGGEEVLYEYTQVKNILIEL